MENIATSFLVYYCIGINVFSFILLGLDKRKAVRNRYRIPEKIFFFVTFIGGTIGTILGMYCFRHKVSKRSFLVKLSAVILLQFLLIYLIYKP